MDIWGKSKKHQQIVEPPEKRISTPAGQRLSVILENGDTPRTTKTRDSRISMRKSTTLGLGDAPRESIEDQSNNSSGYSYSVWSGENTAGEKFGAIRNHKQVVKRGGWKRLALIIAVILAIIIAVAVGVAVGLKKKHSSSKHSDSQGSASVVSGAAYTGSPTATVSISPTLIPSNFPLGSYSMVTFLDTVQANCTSNAATWTCYPYTIFNSDPNKAVATFNWIISSPSTGKYQISSTENPFSISFTNQDLELLDKGQDTERYHFQLTQTKTVSPSSSVTSDNAAVECNFEGTSLQAFLYTKMGKSYPDTSKGETSGNPSFPVWPFAVRVEQAVGGGQDIPTCYKLNNGSKGEKITDGISSQDAGSLCSCLYKNWRTPTH
ncbi:uncharacterized protein BDR25DRAFT_334143 [Lindgomyces ingoldianus]|uniref:Uncharacterized protein n=1 Tax=Lindgomyces ingoldianus TaxID=673940 RepID=A0ACB6QVN1_9PLEO|nr:uncharacterized protein BDR25DRAFT_334143 [Lindgomyces ingoldianus]KAF2470986.1 hypothetical protein BDR25DRAFT_334143 [Lindgomyces ingoldianus]